MATNNKYDRQIRLWGTHGQRILSESSILLLGASSSGSETLKNLILPSIKHFTIVDDSKVTARDVGQNFFLEDERIGEPLAQVMCENLQELNPDDVTGKAILKSVDLFIAHQSTNQLSQDEYSNIKDFSLVIGTDLTNKQALAVSKMCRELSIPFVILRQYGLIGTIRLDVAELCVSEMKLYQKKLMDLRLSEPFPELLEFARNPEMFNLASMEQSVHSHVPFVVILIQAADKWKAEHDGKMPSSFAEKKAFKEQIDSMAQDVSKELNFDEAKKYSYTLFKDPGVTYNTQKIFDDPKLQAVLEGKGSQDPFWLMSAALKLFFEKHKTLPVSGAIPDMISATEFYLKLQHVYVEKAARDVEEFKAILKEVVEKNSIAEAEPYLAKINDQILTFCKNAYENLEITKMRSLEEELSGDQVVLDEMFQWDLSDPSSTGPMWLLGTKAVEEYRDAHNGQYPGLSADPEGDEAAQTKTTSEIESLTSTINALMKKAAPDCQRGDAEKYAFELVRYSDTKLHTVSAFLGGVASQEIIKILIKQYTVLNHTFVYDGIHGRCQVFQ